MARSGGTWVRFGAVAGAERALTELALVLLEPHVTALWFLPQQGKLSSTLTPGKVRPLSALRQCD